jgi:[acyl-carrier-protein] S-malonyltransferase
VVISGEAQAVSQVSLELKQAGARIIPIKISVPSHSRLMAPAAQEFKPYLARVNWQEPVIKVVSNVNASPNSFADLPQLLSDQLVKSVRWEQSIQYMLEKVDYIVEIGPGSTLSGLIKKIDKTRLLGHIEDLVSLNNIAKRMGQLCKQQ